MKTLNPRKVRPASATNRFRGLSVDAVGPKLNNAFVGELENLRSTRMREMGLRSGQFKSGEIFENDILTARAFPDGIRLLSEGSNLHFAQQYPSAYHTTVGDAVFTPYVPSLNLPYDDTTQFNPSDPARTIDMPAEGVSGTGLINGAVSAVPANSGEDKPTQETPSQGMKPKPFSYTEISAVVGATYKKVVATGSGLSTVNVVDSDFETAKCDSIANAVASAGSVTEVTSVFGPSGQTVRGFTSASLASSPWRYSTSASLWSITDLLVTVDLSLYALRRNVSASGQVTVDALDNNGGVVSSAVVKFPIPVADNVDVSVGYELIGRFLAGCDDGYGNHLKVSRELDVTVTYEVIG